MYSNADRQLCVRNNTTNWAVFDNSALPEQVIKLGHGNVIARISRLLWSKFGTDVQ